MNKFYTSLCALLYSLMTLAGVQQPIHNFYKSDYGLGAQNRDVALQKNGILYFANMSALLQYDGQRWSHYDIPSQGNNMRSILIAENGDIYAGAFNEFGVFKAGPEGLSPYRSLSDSLPASQRNFSEIWNINQVGEKIVFQSNFQLITLENGRLSVTMTPFITHLSQAVNNLLYISSDTEGLYLLAGDQLVALPGCETLKGRKIRALLPYHKKELALITEQGELYTYAGRELKALPNPIQRQLAAARVLCAAIQQETLAIGTIQDGLYTLDLRNGEWHHYNLQSGMQSNTVQCAAFDAEGNLWLGLEHGIDYLEINSPYRSLFPRNNPYGSGYNSLLSGGDLYLGTNQGLYWTRYENGDTGEIQRVEGIQGQVYKLREIDGKVFCCLHTGLYEVNRGTARKIADVEGVWDIQPLRRDKNYLLGGSYTGFFLLRRGAGDWQYSHSIQNFVETSRVYEQDVNGDIWMSHGLKGVYRITLSDDLNRAEHYEFYDSSKGFPTNEQISVYQVNDELVFAAENGINRYDPRSDRMEYYRSFNESLMGGGQYYYLNQDGNLLWYVKGDKIGFARIQPNGSLLSDTTNCFSIPESLIYEYFDLTRLSDGNLLISNEEGFTLVYPDMLRRTAPADVYIREVHSIRNDAPLTRQYLKQSGERNKPRITYDNNSLRFSFGTTSFSSTGDQTRFATRLIGYETDWSDVSTSRTREYTNLSEGNYTFQVKGVSRTGETSYTELGFTLLPPWYRSVWAYIAYGVLAAGAVALIILIIRHYERKVEHRKESEMQEQKLRYQEESDRKEKEIIALRNEQLANDLNNKSRELASSTMNLIRKNEILIDLKNELTRIAAALPPDDKAVAKMLNKLIGTINDNIEHDDDWMKFEQNFDTIHQDFMKRLGETYKGLTINDKKLCAYLKMNLVSKDIAPLLNISVRGVEIGRYRLRKKLGLDRDTNLTEFLQNF